MTNIKTHKKLVAIELLLMLTTSSLTVNFAQAEIPQADFDISEIKEDDLVRIILSEQIIEGKLRMRFLGILGDLPPREIQDMLSKEGVITDWAYLEGKTYKSGIILYNGKSLKIDEFLDSNNGKKIDDLTYQIVFSAKDSNSERKFALVVIDSDPKIPQQNLKLNLYS